MTITIRVTRIKSMTITISVISIKSLTITISVTSIKSMVSCAKPIYFGLLLYKMKTNVYLLLGCIN